MDESLVVLASRLHWPLEDVLYLTVHDSCVDKETTQFQVYCSKDLRSAVDARQGLVDMIRGLHDRDTRLYSAVRAKLERQFADGGHALWMGWKKAFDEQFSQIKSFVPDAG